MVESFVSYYIIASGLTILGQFAIWLICILLLIKERSWPSILLFTGSTLIVMGSTLGIFVQSFVARTSNPELLVKYQGIISIINSFFYLIFVAGLILLILKYLGLSQYLKDSPPVEKSN